MTSPGSRWQLLLMADDGRIIPFRRIKGLMIAFIVLFVALGLVCAGLGWWLVSETIRHEETRKKLSESELQVAQCLVDLESRKSPPDEPGMEPKAEAAAAAPLAKTIMEPPELMERSELMEPPETVDHTQQESAPPVEDAQDDDNVQPTENREEKEPAEEVPVQAEKEEVPVQAEKTAKPNETEKKPLQEASAEIETAQNIPADIPVIALGDKFTVSFSEEDKVLAARFRIRNTGTRSSPVQGRCVAVFKPGESGPDQWVTLPSVALVNGEPTGKDGNKFKISRYLDMTVNATGVQNPSIFITATVYVYDGSGEKITEKTYPIENPSLYLSSKKAYDAGKYEEARKGFQKLVETYPKSDHADNSQFWIGETYFKEKLYEKAILAYQNVTVLAPDPLPFSLLDPANFRIFKKNTPKGMENKIGR
jgi:TolA-binding protein